MAKLIYTSESFWFQSLRFLPLSHAAFQRDTGALEKFSRTFGKQELVEICLKYALKWPINNFMLRKREPYKKPIMSFEMSSTTDPAHIRFLLIYFIKCSSLTDFMPGSLTSPSFLMISKIKSDFSSLVSFRIAGKLP